MRRKPNAVKQIMSDVHRDIRAGTLELSGHDGFLAEVTRRVRAAGLSEAQIHELAGPREDAHGGERSGPG